MRALILGASGMVGHAALRVFADGGEAFGTVRDSAARDRLPGRLRANAFITGDLTAPGAAAAVIARTRADVIVNATGAGRDAPPERAALVDGWLPHHLARLAAEADARFVHISTDCVFSGARGSYREDDPSDADSTYGRAKRLGEPEAPALTIRTSLIGPELGDARRGLLEWFLAQPGPVPGWGGAVFSGLPTGTFARLLRDRILPLGLTGVWHLSAEPIAKADLLALIARVWPHPVPIDRVDTPVIDRSLNSDRLRAAIGWTPPPWPDLVRGMRDFG